VQEESQELRKLAVAFIRRNIQEAGRRPEFLNLNADEVELLFRQAVSENEISNTKEPEGQEESVSELFLSIYNWMTADVNLRIETFCSITAEFPLCQVDADILRKIFTEDKNLSQNSFFVKLYFWTIERKYFEDRENYRRTWSQPKTPTQLAQHPSPLLVSSHDCANKNNCIVTREDSGTNQDNLEGEQRPAPSNVTGSMEGNRKRSADNPDDIHFLKEIPFKRNVTAEIDLTVFEATTVPTVEPGCKEPKLYFLCGIQTPRRLLEMDLRDFSMKTVTEFPFEEDFVCLIHHDNKIFAICSRRDTAENQKVRYLNLNKKVWVEVPPFKKPRFRFGWTLVGNSIYILGGSTTGQVLPTIEKFWDPFGDINGDWVTVGVTRHPVADHAVGLMGGKIYVVGGVKSKEKKHRRSLAVSSSLDEFDFERNKWIRKARMPSRKAGHCVAVVGSRLYEIGGGMTVGRRTSKKTCSVYIPEKNEWNLIAPLNQARQNASAFTLDGKIYVVGGNQGPPTMERYDVVKNTWTIVNNCNLPKDGHYQSSYHEMGTYFLRIYYIGHFYVSSKIAIITYVCRFVLYHMHCCNSSTTTVTTFVGEFRTFKKYKHGGID
ncbi:unnamed protein product, partial [Allacma fusca]